MIDGLWIVRFQGPQGNGGGVVVLTNGKVLGGDGGFTYRGGFELKGDAFSAKVLVENFDSTVPNVIGIVGNFELLLEGKVQGEMIAATGALAAAPSAKIVVRLSKRCDLS